MPALAFDAAELVARFRAEFPEAGDPRVYRAPGRVNLIGEHTDYNGGYVLPMAIELACYAAAGRGVNKSIDFVSANLGERASVRLDELDSLPPSGTWTDYVVGVARELCRRGFSIDPVKLLVHSTVPLGGSLSSSASLEVAAALALAGGAAPDPLELARLCLAAETDFVGLPCGIMDQFISLFGREGEALLLDCRSLEWRPVQLPPQSVWLAVNSNVKHSLGESAYRTRVEECRQAVQALGIESLRDATPVMLDCLQGDPLRRARHVVTENRRVLDFAAAAETGDTSEMGRLMKASHESLRFDYEVSCEEVDFLVDTALKLPRVLGARITGGGFGGCTINLLEPGAVGEFQHDLGTAYFRRFGLEATFYRCVPSGGAGRIV
jgi:galactokinase